VAPLDSVGKPKGDGTVNVFDALAILRHAVNLDDWSGIPKPPTAPTNLKATPGDGSITFTWDTVSGLTYNLYLGSTSGVSKTNGIKIAGVTSPRTVSSLTNGSPYYAVITAVNDIGECVESTQASATPVVTPSALLTGRWEATGTSGDTVGVIGALLTQTGITVTGTIVGMTVTNGTFINNIFTGSVSDGKRVHNLNLTLSSDKSTLNGTIITYKNGVYESTINFSLQRKSNNPQNPNTDAPYVVAVSPSPNQTNVPRQNLVITVKWSRPMMGWDALIIGNLTINGVASPGAEGTDLIDSGRSTYDPATNTFVMYSYPGVVLQPQTTYTFALGYNCNPSGCVSDWTDPYGVIASTSNGKYQFSITTGN
jgi:hypothetical protein